jgi:hypothetical protein
MRAARGVKTAGFLALAQSLLKGVPTVGEAVPVSRKVVQVVGEAVPDTGEPVLDTGGPVPDMPDVWPKLATTERGHHG